MLVCDRNGAFVRRRSLTAERVLPALATAPGSPNLIDVVGAEAAHALRNAMARAGVGARPVLAPRLDIGGEIFDAAVHRTTEGLQDEIVVEFEPSGRDHPPSPVDLARSLCDRLAEVEKPCKLLAAAAQLLAVGLNFERVLIAPLADEAENLITDYGPHTPGPRATAAALRRVLAGFSGGSRTIHDIDAASVALLSDASVGDTPLDLRRAVLRQVSEVERTVLRELDARAGLLLPIEGNDGPWGLIACLNRAPALPPLETRAVADLVAECLGLRLRVALSPGAPGVIRIEPAARVAQIAMTRRGSDKAEAECAPTIMIVEDQMLIALDLESNLIERGVKVAAICASAAQALQMLDRFRPDAAVLDFVLRGGNALPVAEALRERGIPFIFATGFSDSSRIPSAFADTPIVSKPYEAKAVFNALNLLLAQTGSAVAADADEGPPNEAG
jgi:CheY-like chemotaxis protein